MSNIPEWAKERAVELANESRTARFGSWRVGDVEHDATMSAFALYIAEHEEPPVDPLADEAQELADQLRINLSAIPWVEGALLAALKRGMELAREAKP